LEFWIIKKIHQGYKSKHQPKFIPSLQPHNGLPSHLLVRVLPCLIAPKINRGLMNFYDDAGTRIYKIAGFWYNLTQDTV
jgi:hypothetical protein